MNRMEGTVMRLTCKFLDIMSHDVLGNIFAYLQIEEVGQLELSLCTSSRKVLLDAKKLDQNF